MLSEPQKSSLLTWPVNGRLARISRPKVSGIGRHEGVLLPSGLVAHTTPEHGPHLCSLHDFSRTLPVVVEKELPPMQHQSAIESVRELLSIKEPYHLVSSNCEIFARKALLEKAESPQALGWTVLVLIAGFWYLSTQ
ncbi:MAG: hypothetical protein EOO38_27185 [Cytophagaceae bacterium]|nr:MAG: hypothetical protein EOO38_27185 [Cytophagaceae bacterium]